ncbi:hypothetical protein [Streptomyces sp. NPDC051183]|uniref:hypothetical protein n=1 Tax=unclassified Streptomyces TaxID=2593676 RepID=UPI003435262D
MPTPPVPRRPAVPRRTPHEGAGPRYLTIADAIARLHAPVPSAPEIARLYGVSLTTAHFVRRALHTRRLSPYRHAPGRS